MIPEAVLVAILLIVFIADFATANKDRRNWLNPLMCVLMAVLTVASVKAQKYSVGEFAHFDNSGAYPALSSAVLSDDLIEVRFFFRNNIRERVDGAASEESLAGLVRLDAVIEIYQCYFVSLGQERIGNKAGRFK